MIFKLVLIIFKKFKLCINCCLYTNDLSQLVRGGRVSKPMALLLRLGVLLLRLLLTMVN